MSSTTISALPSATAAFIPAPVGGIPQRSIDVAPSVFFAALYGLVVPIAFWRSFTKGRRSSLGIGTFIFLVERVVIYSFRAAMATSESKRDRKSLIIYMQLSFGMGLVTIAQDHVGIMRCVLVNATRDIPPHLKNTEFAGQGDHPKQRFWFRRAVEWTSLAYIPATVTGVISGILFWGARNNPETAARVQRFRYASTGVALLLMLWFVIGSIVAVRNLKHVDRKAMWYLICAQSALMIEAVYRLIVMRNHTTSLFDPSAPGSLSTRGDKALFYIFHVLPEWTASCMIGLVSVRKFFHTGPLGDWRANDETKVPKWVQRLQAMRGHPIDANGVELSEKNDGKGVKSSTGAKKSNKRALVWES